MSETEGCILRISSEQWVRQVFSTAIYYTNLRRKWKHGQTILFLHRTIKGDALVGYGLVERASEKNELSEHDRQECEHGGWKRAIEFTYVKKFTNPLPLKDTILKNSKLRGRYFHGLALKQNQIKTILTQAETQH